MKKRIICSLFILAGFVAATETALAWLESSTPGWADAALPMRLFATSWYCLVTLLLIELCEEPSR